MAFDDGSDEPLAGGGAGEPVGKLLLLSFRLHITPAAEKRERLKAPTCNSATREMHITPGIRFVRGCGNRGYFKNVYTDPSAAAEMHITPAAEKRKRLKSTTSSLVAGEMHITPAAEGREILKATAKMKTATAATRMMKMKIDGGDMNE